MHARSWSCHCMSLHACIPAMSLDLPYCHTLAQAPHFLQHAHHQGSIHAHPLVCSCHRHVQAPKPMIGARMCMAFARSTCAGAAWQTTPPSRRMHGPHTYPWTLFMDASAWGHEHDPKTPHVMHRAGVLGPGCMAACSALHMPLASNVHSCSYLAQPAQLSANISTAFLCLSFSHKKTLLFHFPLLLN